MTADENATITLNIVLFHIFNMLKLITGPRNISNYIQNSFTKPSLPSIARTMATGAANNEDLKINKLFDVSKYSAVVTGGGTGIGLMITQTLVAKGAKVYITGRRKEALETVVQKYSTGPGKIIA
jgi:short chain dehydrogenase